MTRIAIFGDAHGASSSLRELISNIRSKYGDIQIFSTGDLCDRGKDAPGVVQTCIDEGIISCLGNHDEWFQTMLKNDLFEATRAHAGWTYQYNGGQQTLAQYGVNIDGNYSAEDCWNEFRANVPDAHKKYIMELPLWIETDYCYIVHSGAGTRCSGRINNLNKVPKGSRFNSKEYPWSKFWSKDDLIWSCPRDIMNPLSWQTFDKPQVCGHIVREEPLVGDNYIGVDTGASCRSTGRLTALILPDNEFVSVEAPINPDMLE